MPSCCTCTDGARGFTWWLVLQLQEIKSQLASAGMGNVLLGGNYVAGVALGKCVEFSYDFAADIASQLKAAKA